MAFSVLRIARCSPIWVCLYAVKSLDDFKPAMPDRPGVIANLNKIYIALDQPLPTTETAITDCVFTTNCSFLYECFYMFHADSRTRTLRAPWMQIWCVEEYGEFIHESEKRMNILLNISRDNSAQRYTNSFFNFNLDILILFSLDTAIKTSR